MTSLVDQSIAALHSRHDRLRDRLSGLTDDQLLRPSGAAEWTVAQVVSHLGSGAEISLAGVQAAKVGEPAPGQEFNQQVWDRWDAMTPSQLAEQLIVHDAALLATYDAVDEPTRQSLSLQVSFLPTPLPFVTLLGMRLNEAAAHGWDIDIAYDPAAAIGSDAADALLEHLGDGLSFMLRFTGKADQLTEPVELAIGETGRSVLIDEAVSVAVTSADPNARFTGPTEALIRLFAGRLAPERTPATVAVTGAVTLDELRRVFPGY
jgi:uncharacterized protein (TIGR03083 family)